MNLVLVKLCLHARDAMPKGGAITIELQNTRLPPEPGGEFVRLTVSDTSAGMPAEALPGLFKPNSPATHAGHGAGHGLSIVNALVREHGGWIEVESKLGQGTGFHIFLPRCPSCPGVAPKPAETPPIRQTEATETVLLVDDDSRTRDFMRAVLAYRGYKVQDVCYGHEALKTLGSGVPIDLLIMGVGTPHLDGWQVLAKIHARHPALPVILSSPAPEGEELEARIEAAGVKSRLLKPFSSTQLAQLVRQTLDASKAR